MTHLVELEKIATDVTSEQMSKCCKVISFQTQEDYYMVDSSDGTKDYEVHYDPKLGFTCNCKAGKKGFAGCKNFCWHVRASVACFLEEEAAMQEMLEAEQTAKAEGTLQHPQALPVISRTEAQLPEWIRRARPSKGMDKAPREY